MRLRGVPTGRPQRRRWKCGNNAPSQAAVIVTILSFIVASVKSDCNPRCRCTWIDGMFRFNCTAAGFTSIPFFNESIQRLDLTWHNINTLHDRAFHSMGLHDLKQLYMRNGTLSEISRYAFAGMGILTDLDLSYNRLAFLPEKVFSENIRLMRLYLSGNPLRILRRDQFPSLQHFELLHLDNCHLHKIDEDAFRLSTTLQHIHLHSNKLESITKETFKHLYKLKTLSLDNNPWNCDCELKDFRTWYLKRHMYMIVPTCETSYEGRKGIAWSDTVEQQFLCYPVVYVPEPMVMNVDLGENVTLHCHVYGYPEPRVIWLHNGEDVSMNSDMFTIWGKYESARTRWLNVTIRNFTASAELTCEAKNFLGTATSNHTVLITKRYSTHFIKSSSTWYILSASVVFGLVTVIVITCIITFACMSYSKKERQKHRLEIGPDGYYDQQSRLLNAKAEQSTKSKDSTNTKKMEIKNSTETLKKHSTLPIYKGKSNKTGRQNEAANTSTITTFPISGLYPPPPEFSNGDDPSLNNTLGNIYISVSLSPEPSVTVERFPDLVNTHGRSNLKKSVSSSTIPRRLAREDGRMQFSVPVYDNMGKRITVGGSTAMSTMSLSRRREDTPTPPPPPPPPPPECTKTDFDYVPL